MTDEALGRWLTRRAVPLPSGPGATPDVVGATVAGADVVGVGVAVRHAAGTVAAVRAVLDDLVAHHGFRALVIEGTDPPFATAAALDRYVVRGEGDPRELVAASQGFLRTAETLGLVRRLRARNAEHPDDPVRIVHDARSAPWTSLAEVERGLADRVLDWRAGTGQRVVYWGGAAHALAGDPRTVSPGGPDPTHRNAGGHLRSALGAGFVAVAATVGRVAARDGVAAVPEAPDGFVEATLAALPAASWIALGGSDVPPEVAARLTAPLRTRMIGPGYDPARDADHHVGAPSVRGAIDAFLHVPRSDADTPL